MHLVSCQRVIKCVSRVNIFFLKCISLVGTGRRFGKYWEIVCQQSCIVCVSMMVCHAIYSFHCMRMKMLFSARFCSCPFFLRFLLFSNAKPGRIILEEKSCCVWRWLIALPGIHLLFIQWKISSYLFLRALYSKICFVNRWCFL